MYLLRQQEGRVKVEIRKKLSKISTFTSDVDGVYKNIKHKLTFMPYRDVSTLPHNLGGKSGLPKW